MLCAIAFLVADSSPVQAQTLGDAVRRAVATNPAIKSASANRRARNYELDQATGRLLPQLSMNSSLQAQQVDLVLSASVSPTTTFFGHAVKYQCA